MARWVPVLFLAAAAALAAQGGKPSSQQDQKGQKELKTQRPAQQQGEKEEVPPEEDTDLAPKVYAFNPLQAEKEVRVGNYYFHKGKFRAAAGRYLEATKWNDGYGEAWLKLGEAREKTKDTQAAKEAYAKYLQISPDAKNVGEIRKRMEKMK
jgi:tetratricopeptide (TPR) repeat protein